MKSCVASRMRAPLVPPDAAGVGADPEDAVTAVEGIPTRIRSVARGTSSYAIVQSQGLLIRKNKLGVKLGTYLPFRLELLQTYKRPRDALVREDGLVLL